MRFESSPGSQHSSFLNSSLVFVDGIAAWISMLTGRKLQWDPVKMELVGSEDAAKLLSREQRAPWHLA